MAATFFISDLHLSADHPALVSRFLQFLNQATTQAEALYVLGDLFEYWAGDDDLDDPFHAEIVSALHTLAERGVKLAFMHGNRDFLMGEGFAAACGGQWLPDPLRLNLYGTPTLLSHGDALCTADAEYQAFRNQVRSPAWQKTFLTQPLAERKAQIEQLRAQSEQQKQIKSYDIMDVAPQAVGQLLRNHAHPRLIHGHTHRPGHHFHRVDDHICERWVLPDWAENENGEVRGGYLRCDARGCELVKL